MEGKKSDKFQTYHLYSFAIREADNHEENKRKRSARGDDCIGSVGAQSLEEAVNYNFRAFLHHIMWRHVINLNEAECSLCCSQLRYTTRNAPTPFWVSRLNARFILKRVPI